MIKTRNPPRSIQVTPKDPTHRIPPNTLSSPLGRSEVERKRRASAWPPAQRRLVVVLRGRHGTHCNVVENGFYYRAQRKEQGRARTTEHHNQPRKTMPKKMRHCALYTRAYVSILTAKRSPAQQRASGCKLRLDTRPRTSCCPLDDSQE